MARRPAEAFPVGEYVREEMEARGWDAAALAEAAGFTHRLACEVIEDRHACTRLIAFGLAQAFGTSPHLWRHLAAAPAPTPAETPQRARE